MTMSKVMVFLSCESKHMEYLGTYRFRIATAFFVKRFLSWAYACGLHTQLTKLVSLYVILLIVNSVAWYVLYNFKKQY